MPLTLNEIKSLVAALGVKIPEEILAQKAKAEEFKARRDKIVAEAGGKPDDWRLKADFDTVLNRAAEAAGQKQFDAALKLIEQAEQLLQQPETLPPPVAPVRSASPPQSGAAETVAFDDRGFQENWSVAKQVWLDCLETVNGQLDKVRRQMLASGDPDLKIIADRGLPALTDNHKDARDEGVV